MALNRVWLITRNSAIKGIIKGVTCTIKKMSVQVCTHTHKGNYQGYTFL